MQNNTKLCTKCKIIKSFSEFASNKTRKDGLKSHCKKCENAASRIRNKKYAEERKHNPALNKIFRERTRLEKLKYIFGITGEDYEQMLESQKSCCAICFISTSELGKRLVVDHCHKSGKIRGLLCIRCNTGIGMLKDSVELLQNALTYLR